MLRLGRSYLIRWLVPGLCIAGIGWIALEYFVPSPPSKITIATALRGTTYDYFGQRYKERFARSGVDLELRETAGAVQNLRLLQDPNSGVDIAFVTGGISDSSHAPNLLSMGLIFNDPIWIFYSSTESLDSLPQLKGKRIAVGPEESGARYVAERLLGKANVNSKTATLLPFGGDAAVDALDDGKVDVILIVGGSDIAGRQRATHKSPSSAYELFNSRSLHAHFSRSCSAGATQRGDRHRSAQSAQ